MGELFSRRIGHAQPDIQKELEKIGLDMDMQKICRLVTSRVTNMEKDIETYGHELVIFMLENMHSELIYGTPESEAVVSFEYREYGCFIVICENTDPGELKSRCTNLIGRIEDFLECTVTCCISRPCTIDEFYGVYHDDEDLFFQNIAYYGGVFLEEQTTGSEQGQEPVLKLSQMGEYLVTKDKKAFLDFLKKVMNVAIEQKCLNREMLRRVSDEIQQAVYVHLAGQGIQISQLLGDETFHRIMETSDRSVTDMLRWVNYLLDCVFSYEEEIKKSQTTIEKVNQYIRDNYKEDIGRNEIGAHFYLAPEYLAKMYKKKTGKNLKDYINEYRIEKAKEFLCTDEGVRVSDVALEVGFNNFSYFSTVFKKYTGVTPNEFRRNWETRKL